MKDKKKGDDHVVRRLAVKSNLLYSDLSETTKLRSKDNEVPLCPKPHRLGSAVPEILNPFRCIKHRFVPFFFTCNHFVYITLFLKPQEQVHPFRIKLMQMVLNN